MDDLEKYEKRLTEKHPSYKKDLKEINARVEMVSAIISRREELGLSQRDLAKLCELPQSSIARVESFKVSPTIDTFIKMLVNLGLTIKVVPIENN